MNENIKKRFMGKIKKTKRGCWIWKASKRGKYGAFSIGCGKNKKTVAAHRFSYELFNGKIKNDMYVCHQCDEPLCVNPNHLFLGSHTENMIDASKKGRLSKKRLTSRQVLNIRKSNLSVDELSKKYDVWTTTIRRIINNQSWNGKNI